MTLPLVAIILLIIVKLIEMVDILKKQVNLISESLCLADLLGGTFMQDETGYPHFVPYGKTLADVLENEKRDENEKH